MVALWQFLLELASISPLGYQANDDCLTLEAGRDDVKAEGGSTLNNLSIFPLIWPHKQL